LKRRVRGCGFVGLASVVASWVGRQSSGRVGSSQSLTVVEWVRRNLLQWSSGFVVVAPAVVVAEPVCKEQNKFIRGESLLPP
jgi:hypothetical protein